MGCGGRICGAGRSDFALVEEEPSLVGEGMDDGMEEMSGRRNRVSVLRQAIFSTAGAAELEELWHDLTGSQIAALLRTSE